MRDEGVYKTQEGKKKIYNAYNWLTDKIKEYSKNKIINYNKDSLQEDYIIKKTIYLGT